MRAEPKTILRFLLENFEALRDLFEIQSADGIVKKEILKTICEKYDSNIQYQLLDYKILHAINDDFEFHSVYLNLIEFVVSEFRPLLPETIEKYNTSISQLYQRIIEGIDGDKAILKVRVAELANEIRSFFELVERNTISLLKETRNIKANVDKIDYREKIIRASRWIDEYIVPLNRILDVNHSESVANRLYNIAQFVNSKRLSFSDEQLRLQFEQLYHLIISINDGLLRQSKTLTTELLPLIDRIRTESLILTGWIEFLDKPEKYDTPAILKPVKDFAYSENVYLNTKEFFEQFSKEEVVYLEEEETEKEKWIFNKRYYKNKLKENLPVDDFFGWCAETLAKEYKTIEVEKFFQIISLLFEQDLDPQVVETAYLIQIKTDKTTIRIPKITVNENA
ncbi:MAG: hypothetical protein WDO16_10955 [Bacteroidota bacterium]